MTSHASLPRSSLLIVIFIVAISTVTATCTFDSDCSPSAYCYSSRYSSTSECQPSIDIGSKCSRGISSRKQCADGYCNTSNITSICTKLIPSNGECDPVRYTPLYTCEKGNYCQLLNNITKSGKCQPTLPNGAPCDMDQACTSQFCGIKNDAKTGTCATHPFVDLIVAAGKGLVMIILIVIGSIIACCIGICCWCYKMGKRPSVIFNRQAPIVATIPMHDNPRASAYHPPQPRQQQQQTRYHQLHDRV